jgi:IS30 family transposase
VQHHPPRRAQRCLSVAEREEISRGVAAGHAARLGRAPSTVSRELARNGGRYRYRAQAADDDAFGRLCRSMPIVASGSSSSDWQQLTGPGCRVES